MIIIIVIDNTNNIIFKFADYVNDLWKHLFRHLFIFQLISVFIYIKTYLFLHWNKFLILFRFTFFLLLLIFLYISFIYLFFFLSTRPVIAQLIITGMEHNAAHAQAAPLGLVWGNLVQKPKTPNVKNAILAMITRTAQEWRSA